MRAIYCIIINYTIFSQARFNSLVIFYVDCCAFLRVSHALVKLSDTLLYKLHLRRVKVV